MRSEIVAAILAELQKLRTLPIAKYLTFCTLIVAVAVPTAIGATTSGQRNASAWAELPLIAMYVSICVAGLAALPITHEHDGRQWGASLLAVPHRRRLVVGKLLTVLFAACGASGLSLMVCVAAIALRDPTGWNGVPWRQVAGASVYVAGMGLAAATVALLVKRLVATLALFLSWVLVLSPLVASQWAAVRWLPDRALRVLVDHQAVATDVVTAFTVSLLWLLLLGGLGVRSLYRQDAE